MKSRSIAGAGGTVFVEAGGGMGGAAVALEAAAEA
jgi:hypothetical protein